LPGGPQGVPKPTERHSRSSMSWVFPGVSSPVGHAWNTSLGRRPGASDTDARATSAGSSRMWRSKRLYSELLPGDRAPHPISKGAP
ncbi:unnamed protein product, partial [Lampetra planeri]